MFVNWCAMQWKLFIDSNFIPEFVTHKQLAEGIMADPWRGFWIRETGTGHQVALIHDRYMMMMTICYAQTDLSFLYISPIWCTCFILQHTYYISYIDIFRAITCSSSGGTNSILQHLVYHSVWALFESGVHFHTAHNTVAHREWHTRCCKIKFEPPEDEHIIARNISRHLM
jgi:hypothetical protein